LESSWEGGGAQAGGKGTRGLKEILIGCTGPKERYFPAPKGCWDKGEKRWGVGAKRKWHRLKRKKKGVPLICGEGEGPDGERRKGDRGVKKN